MVGNYTFFFKKHCPSGPRKILKDTCTYNSPTKFVLSYNNDPLNQTVKYFQLLMKAKGKAQEWTLLLEKKKELQTSTEDLEIT